MPCAVIASAWSLLSRIASRPPCTFGCSVLTRPSIISGKPVSSETSFTLRPAAAIAFAVPPVETSSTSCAASAFANSIRPVLSETERRARVTRRGWSVMSKILCLKECLCPGARLLSLALPDGAPSKVASRASEGSIAVFGRFHNVQNGPNRMRLQRKFWLPPCISAGIRDRRRGGGADKTPADRGCLPRILTDHDLRGAARAVIAGQGHAVLEFHLVVERLEGPDVAIREHQHDAAGVGQPARLHRRVQMESQREIGVRTLEAPALRRRQRVLAVDARAVIGDHQHAAVDRAEFCEVAVMRRREQRAVLHDFAIALDLDGAAGDRSTVQEPLHSRHLHELA